MTILDDLIKTTVKIQTDTGDLGTGFFFKFDINENESVQTIITNKHVLKGAGSISLVFSLNDYFDSKERIVKTYSLNMNNILSKIIMHPDPQIDLCAIEINEILRHQIAVNLNFQIKYITEQNIPSVDELEFLNYMEDIIMIGYPSGISDERNNLPIIRRGTTASHPAIKFNGEEEFLADMTITPGSSGSPVFIYDSNGFKDKNNNVFVGQERLIFVGINKAVYSLNAKGEILEEYIPTKFYANTKVGINLGLIIMSRALIGIKEEMIKILKGE